MNADELRALVRDVPDFPKPGITFKDITPLLANSAALRSAARLMSDGFRDAGATIVCGIESRGFILGALVARELDVGFVPVRKPNKLPARKLSIEYSLEYGKDILEIHADAFVAGASVLVVDDVLATGGTALATCELVEKTGAKVVGASFLIELGFLQGRAKLGQREAHAVLHY